VAASAGERGGLAILAKAAMACHGMGLLQREDGARVALCLDSWLCERADWHGAGHYTLWCCCPRSRKKNTDAGARGLSEQRHALAIYAKLQHECVVALSSGCVTPAADDRCRFCMAGPPFQTDDPEPWTSVIMSFTYLGHDGTPSNPIRLDRRLKPTGSRT